MHYNASSQFDKNISHQRNSVGVRDSPDTRHQRRRSASASFQLPEPVRRGGHSHRRQRSQSIESTKSLTTLEGGVQDGDPCSFTIPDTTLQPKRIKAVHTVSGLEGALGKLGAFSFKKMKITGKRRIKTQERTSLLHYRDTSAAAPTAGTTARTHPVVWKENDDCYFRSAASPASEGNNRARNPFATPPPSPSTDFRRRDSLDLAPVLVTDLTDDPRFWEKKVMHGRVKVGRLLGERAGVAQYEKMISVHLSQVGEDDRKT